MSDNDVRERLERANERLTNALMHIINRVSTERRDDEHGTIFATGWWALKWAAWEIDGSAEGRTRLFQIVSESREGQDG